MFSTCFYTSFLPRDFLSFCIDCLYTCSYSHLHLHILITPSLSFPLPVLFLNLLLLFPPLAFLLLVLLLLILLQLIQIPSLVLLSMLSPTIDAGSTSVQDNSSDLSPSEVSNSAALEIVPTVNSHPMQTRSKSGIHLPT